MTDIPPVTRNVDRLLGWVAQICTWISGLCLVTLVATFGWLVFGRYVLNSTPTWVEQLSLLMIVTITFLSSAVGVHEKSHLSVDILPGLLPPELRRWVHVLIYATLFGFGLVMMVNAYGLVRFTWAQRIPLLDIPEGVRSIPMTVSGGLIMLFSVGNTLRALTGPLEDDLPPVIEQDELLPDADALKKDLM
ncbi:TRAP transporter small permease [Seohaeicola saemankumensis]|nr:TRAP transporter small permease [Seohaeicola saemankumensis]MCA0872984.1 TRAP transporter small permease [Seohaeicola saemankumensis]